MSLRSEQSRFAEDVQKLLKWIFEQGYEVTFGEALRTDDQQELYYTGKTLHIDDGNLEVLNGHKRTRTLKSMHLLKLAIDLNIFINGRLTYSKEKLQSVGDYWESLSPKNKWGGNFKTFIDTPHFQRKF